MRDYNAAARWWAFAVGLVVFVAVAALVGTGATRGFDERLIRQFREPNDPSEPVGPPWVADVGRDLTALGGGAAMTLLVSAVAGYLLMCRKRRAAVFLVATVVSGSILCTLLKDLFDRPRPELVPHLSYVSNASFPSGHSMQSAIVYLTLGAILAEFVKERRLKLYAVGVAVFLTLLVGASRVFMGVHYPTDVVAGWSLGMAWASGCDLWARRLQKAGQVEPASSGPAADALGEPAT